jgi:phenylpropionate dioxygenase-like ring-hydroxylating dioxygenase large terminal subunit
MSRTIIASETKTQSAMGLPVSWYFDPAILAIERQRLFGSGPTYAGHDSLVRQNGDYAVLAGQLAGNVLVRHEGRTHLISNVCRHRQAELLSGCGHTKHIVCPIHNWAYDLDGRQIAAPHFAENPCLNLERTELAEWNGMYFTGPRDVRRELAPLAGWTELSASDYVQVRVDDEVHELNWKAFLEVYLEDYHIGVVHPGFRAFVDPADVRAALNSMGGERFYCEQVNVRWPLPPAGSPLFGEYQKVLMDVLAGRRPPFAAIWLCIFPGQLFEWYPFCMVATSYTPLSPTRTQLRSEYYFDREIAQTRRDYVEISLATLDEVTREDHEAAVALQNGRRALWERGDDLQGPYQLPMEQGLKRFHDCLRAVVHG